MKSFWAIEISPWARHQVPPCYQVLATCLPPHLTHWSFLYIRLTHLCHTLLCWQQFCVVVVKVAPGSFSSFFLLLLHHNITLLSRALTLDLLEKKRLHCDDF